MGRPSTFTKEESDRLFDMRDRQGLSWHVIGDELGRYYRHCWDHYFMLHENKGRGPFTEAEDAQLVRLVEEAMQAAHAAREARALDGLEEERVN